MNKFENEYSEVMKTCLKKGEKIRGRNGFIRQIVGAQIRANLLNGFPAVTGKKIFPKSCFIETEWMIKGLTNIDYLNKRGVHIWDLWANEDGSLGKVYGHQLINFNGENQLQDVISSAKLDPYSRRLLCSMWNVNDLKDMNLPPCHYAFQFVIAKEYIDIVVSMRSLDLFVGLPYDVCMYSTILLSMANELNLIAREVVINAANAHIYEQHVGMAATYNLRKKRKLPQIKVGCTLSNFDYTKIELINYNPDTRLKVEVIK